MYFLARLLTTVARGAVEYNIIANTLEYRAHGRGFLWRIVRIRGAREYGAVLLGWDEKG